MTTATTHSDNREVFDEAEFFIDIPEEVSLPCDEDSWREEEDENLSDDPGITEEELIALLAEAGLLETPSACSNTDKPEHISKSSFVKGMQCEKLLWLDAKDKSRLAEQDSTRAEMGKEVGLAARELFPGGAAVPFEGTSHQWRISRTNELIQSGERTIYEATFEFENIRVMVDILHITGEGTVELYEVKASTFDPDKKIKKFEQYLSDIAVQVYVLSGCGYTVEKASLVLLNANYVREERLETDRLFSVLDVTANAYEQQQLVREKTGRFFDLLEKNNEPDIDIGWHCKNPSECPAREYCWKQQRKIPDYSVFNIFPLTKKSKALTLYRDGIVEIDDIPEDFPMTEIQYEKVRLHKENTVRMDKEGIREFLDGISYPVYHLDFETYQTPIPLYRGTRPFQQIPFQYSVHIEHADGSVEHKEFLAKEGEDPRYALASALVKDIPQDATVLAYHSSFEEGVLLDLAGDIRAHAARLQNIAENLIDLEIPFRKRYFHVPEMQGRSSIKVVLPALVPEMDKAYKELDLVHNGSEAMSVFPRLSKMSEEEKSRYRKALLEYCKLDTYAMLQLLQVLKSSIPL